MTEIKVSRRRVNELVALRLETLAKKQRLRRPAVRRSGWTQSAAGAAKVARILEAHARMEARQTPGERSRSLVGSVCLQACTRLRPSFREEMHWAVLRRQAEKNGNADSLPPRTRETGPCLRCLDRAESRLLRLVRAWAAREAQREADVL